VIAFAEELGQSNHVSLLNETLEEEKETDEKLTGLAGDINAQANLARKRAKKMPRRRKDPATQPSCAAPIGCYKKNAVHGNYTTNGVLLCFQKAAEFREPYCAASSAYCRQCSR
jgi:hypothetical protein